MGNGSYYRSEESDCDKEDDLKIIAAKTNLNLKTAIPNSDTIMGEIMMCNQDPEKLESKLIIHASRFTKHDFLEVARLLKR